MPPHSYPSRWRKRPPVVEATQWDTTNADIITSWSCGAVIATTTDGDIPDLWLIAGNARYLIEPGDWVVRSTQSHDRTYWVAPAESFEAEYEQAPPTP